MTKTVQDIIQDFMDASGCNTYRKLEGILANDTRYPTHAAIHGWMEYDTRPNVNKLQLIEPRIENKEAKALIRDLIRAASFS